MKKDPTEFRQRFQRWKNGEQVYEAGLPHYEDGKDARKLEYHPEEDYYYGGNLFGKGNELVVKGKASPKLYMHPWKTERDLRQEQNEYYYSQPQQEGWKRDLEHPLSPVDPVGEFVVASAALNPVLNPAFKYMFGGIGEAAKDAALNVAKSNSPIMQYIRYPIGKILYGFDAEFPTMYRKIKALPPEPNNRMVQVSNPNPRFAFKYTGEESPEITNFTYDSPVRRHSFGNWDSGFTIAFPGKKLLGKNVISTEPSDLFTYGNNIKIPLKDITLISGDLDEIAIANKFGYNVHTTPKLQQLHREGYSPGFSQTKGGRKISLIKENYGNYAKEVELETRKIFRNPTQKDVDFMNFVLQPKIKGQTYLPQQLDYLINNGIGVFGDRIGNAQLRDYLYDPDRWKYLLYDPATHAESNFREQMGIVLKKDIPLNIRD